MKEQKQEKQFAKLCKDCRRTCKQPATTILIKCNRYYAFPFRLKEENLKQGSLFDAPIRTAPRTKKLTKKKG